MSRSGLRKRTGFALYHQLYTSLRQQLDDGTAAPGSRLESEPALSMRYRISRTTVRRALARLEREGRLLRRPGAGTFVRAPRERSDDQAYAALLQDLRAMSRVTKTRWLQHQIVPTPPHILAKDATFGRRALVIRRTRSFRGRPFIHLTHYVPERFASIFSRRKIGNRATVLVFNDAGIPPHAADQLVTAVAAGDRVAQALRVPTGSPLLAIRRYVFTSKGEVIDYQDALYVPELYGLRMRVTPEDLERGGMRWVPETRATEGRSRKGAGAVTRRTHR